jgi:hypothetical protein
LTFMAKAQTSEPLLLILSQPLATLLPPIFNSKTRTYPTQQPLRLTMKQSKSWQ